MISKLSFVFSKVFGEINLLPEMLIQKRGRGWGRQADAEKKEQGYRERTGFRQRRIQIRIILSLHDR